MPAHAGNKLVAVVSPRALDDSRRRSLAMARSWLRSSTTPRRKATSLWNSERPRASMSGDIRPRMRKPAARNLIRSYSGVVTPPYLCPQARLPRAEIPSKHPCARRRASRSASREDCGPPKGGRVPATIAAKRIAFRPLLSAEQLRQLDDVRRDPPRFVFRHEVRCRSPSRFMLENRVLHIETSRCCRERPPPQSMPRLRDSA